MDLLQNTLLFDFYGELLTEKQKQIYGLYYQDDLSLTEIGQELSISRQAVRDQIKRTEKILTGYEEKLCLIERFMYHKNAVKKIKLLIDGMEDKFQVPGDIVAIIEEIRKIADEILD